MSALAHSILLSKKLIKGKIMKKTRIPRINILRNIYIIISKKKKKKKKSQKKVLPGSESKTFCDDKCKDELALKKNNCSMISTKKNYL